MKPNKIETPEKLFREFKIEKSDSEKRSIDEDARTVEVAFSSEDPYLRYFGYEILDHGAGAVDLGRLSDGAAVLVEHNRSDQVGVVESVSIDSDKVGRAKLRFGRSERANEIFQDVVDGIRSKISVGYFVNKMVLESEDREGEDVYRVTSWTPFEVSFVSIPADTTVGVGKSLEEPSKPIQEFKKMDPEIKVDENQIRAQIQQAELKRIQAIESIGDKFDRKELARNAIRDGVSADEFNLKVLDTLGSDVVRNTTNATCEIGLTRKEIKKFSFIRAINALANPTNKQMQEAAAFEFECSRAASNLLGKTPEGVLVPIDVLTRELQVGTATEAGNLVETTLDEANFIDVLRNASSVMDLVTVLDGLIGDLAIPKQTGTATAYWVAESGTITTSELTTGQVSLSPKTLGAFTDISRKALLQTTPAIEMIVRNDLFRKLALEIDRVILNGSGASNQPTGVANFTDTNDVVIGTNGGPITWAKVVELETAVNNDNANFGSSVYITNSKVMGNLKTIEKATNTARFLYENGQLNGYNVRVSNQVPSTLDKGTSTGVCSQMFFGDFSQVLLGMWSGFDLTVSKEALLTAGGIRVVALQDIDVAGRHDEAFAVVEDLTTA